MSRPEARDRALLALYEMDQRRFDAPDVSGLSPKATRLVLGVMAHLEQIDAEIARLSTHWRPERMPVVDRAVLRLGAYELLHTAETPPAVVLAEATRLASTFSTEKSAPFVNGVLAALAGEVAATQADG